MKKTAKHAWEAEILHAQQNNQKKLDGILERVISHIPKGRRDIMVDRFIRVMVSCQMVLTRKCIGTSFDRSGGRIPISSNLDYLDIKMSHCKSFKKYSQ